LIVAVAISGIRITIEYAGQHIPALKLLTTAAILFGFQGLVKVHRNPPLPINTDQHNPIMTAANWAKVTLHLPDKGLLSFVMVKRFSAEAEGQKSEAHRAASPGSGP
jgi:hypothetical protein